MAVKNVRGTLPFDFMIPKVDWSPCRIADLPDWYHAKRVCIDVETKDPDLKALGPGNFRPGNHIVGIGIAVEDGPSHYLPIRHEGGDNMHVEHVLDYFRDQAKNFHGTVVGANLGYDLGFLEKDEIYFDNSRVQFMDVLHRAVLLYELHNRYSLDAVAEREGLPGKDETMLRAMAEAYGVDPKEELYKLPGRAADAYCRQDVRLPLTLARRQDTQIADNKLERVVALEAAVLPVLVKMRRRGVRVSIAKIYNIIEWCKKSIQEKLDFVSHTCGATIRIDQIWKAEIIGFVLQKANIRVPVTATGKSSIKNSWLEKNAGAIGKALSRARAVGRLMQFAHQTLEYQINGRIHGVTHQLRNTKDVGNDNEEEKGARFGRFSMEAPNLQQQPVRDDEFGEMWRDVYEPEPGSFWVCSDWSQQEPRIAVHYAELLGLPGAAEFAERYRKNPATDCHQMLADLTGIARKIVKNYFNGSIYGMGDAKLCRAIGHPTIWIQRNGKSIEVPGPEGKVIIDKFKRDMPWVSLLTREAAKKAEKVGHVWTIDGRKCNFPKDDQGNYDWTHKAFSRIGQGGAAGQMKATLVEADKAGIPIQLAVHDEFDYSETDPKRAKQLAQLQRDTVKFNVPMLVDLEVGPSWGRLQKLSVGEAVVNAFQALKGM